MEPQDKPAEGTAGRRRREQLGVVVSASMQKSVVVAVARTVRHATYRKSIKRTSTFMAICFSRADLFNSSVKNW